MGAHKILNETLLRLTKALEGGASDLNCLRSWSAFIRVRDGNRCLACSSTHSLAAHHIVRKSFLPEARFQTGNGITLCSKCHRSAHAGFNGKADLSQPMDAQGGEKIDMLAELFGILLENARSRGMLCDIYYHFSEIALRKFKLFQGFDPSTEFSGYPLEQAYSIWRQAPRNVLNAVLAANGLGPISVPDPGSIYVEFR
jgi:hypothetical protein